jgi:hypothetical protein
LPDYAKLSFFDAWVVRLESPKWCKKVFPKAITCAALLDPAESLPISASACLLAA